MPEMFMLLPIMYLVVVVALAIVIVSALWRIMRAQEGTAEALHRIAEALAQRPGPPA